MAKLNGSIPPELLEAENKLKDNLTRTDEFLKRHRKVFEQFEDLVNERNAGIDECKKMAKQAKCSTDLFKANTASNTHYDSERFLELFGSEMLVACSKVMGNKVKAHIQTGQLDKDDVDGTIVEDEPTIRVTGPDKWVIG